MKPCAIASSFAWKNVSPCEDKWKYWMISETDLKEIRPKSPTATPSTAHVQSGIPIPKAIRVKNFSPDDWEDFIEEWSTSLVDSYIKVRRFGGSGDCGVDIAGFCTSKGFEDTWDNYQCKRYAHPLRPSDIWVELGKIIYYSHIGEYTPPRKHYFVAPLDVGTALEKLLNKPTELRDQFKEHWDGYCKIGITSTNEIELSGKLLSYVDAFDFTIFSSKSHVELIEAHSHTGFHSVRFGGGLPVRPDPEEPPAVPAASESRYIRQLLEAYGDHLGIPIRDMSALVAHSMLEKDYRRQRERFYHAEALRNFARDTVPEGTFDYLQDEVYHGVVDVTDSSYPNGYKRMKATVAQASSVALTANPLASVTKSQDRQGICHQLANEDRLKWVMDDD
ncbi:MAG: ABC-three component system protein [Spirochaetia bacterium]|nr:ABC-three component system protein [Spirochaetia bacterium]